MRPNKKESNLKKRLKKNELNKKQKKAYFITILSIVIILLLFVLVFIFNKAKIIRVEIRGLNRLNAIDVINESGLSQYNNHSVIMLPYDKIKKEVEKNPILKVINIKTSLPDTLIIEVEERGTLFLLEYKGRIYEITDEGYVIFKSSIENYDVPYVTGLNIDPENNTVKDEYTKYITDVLYHLKIKDINVYNSISEMNAFGKDLIIYPRVYPVKVKVEKYIKTDKFIELAAILKTLQTQNKYVSEIDFRFKEAIIR